MQEQPAGIGIGMRLDFARTMLAEQPAEIAWLEVHPENYIHRGGRYAERLRQCRERWPIVTHGLTMCFGCVDPFEAKYLADLKKFLHDIGTPWHSDHLCFSGADGAFAHDLLPFPFNEEAAQTATARIIEARDALDKPIAIENVSYYARSSQSESSEEEFVVEVLERSDAQLLLDVNNIYVNSKNHGFDPRKYVDRIPPQRVVQIHIAGHYVRKDGIRIDTHGESICSDVYDLLDYTLRRMGPKPVLLERDNNIPSFAELMIEVRRLDQLYRNAVGSTAESDAAHRDEIGAKAS